MALDNATVACHALEDGTVEIVWREADIGHALRLLVREADLAAAVEDAGAESRDALWPGSSVEDAGFSMLLVHLDEVLATRDTTSPLRITVEGLEWPDALRPGYPP